MCQSAGQHKTHQASLEQTNYVATIEFRSFSRGPTDCLLLSSSPTHRAALKHCFATTAPPAQQKSLEVLVCERGWKSSPAKTRGRVTKKSRPPASHPYSQLEENNTNDAIPILSSGDPLAFTGKFAGGVCADFRRRAPWYFSDWVDAFKSENQSQALASILCLFFVCLSQPVTFGVLLNKYTDGQLGVMETILSWYGCSNFHFM